MADIDLVRSLRTVEASELRHVFLQPPDLLLCRQLAGMAGAGGMSPENSRAPFGQERINSLIDLVVTFGRTGGDDRYQTEFFPVGPQFGGELGRLFDHIVSPFGACRSLRGRNDSG